MWGKTISIFEIKNAIVAYRTKVAYEQPVIPLNRQRLRLLLGVPDIEKITIMEQIAQELGLPMANCSMT